MELVDCQRGVGLLRTWKPKERVRMNVVRPLAISWVLVFLLIGNLAWAQDNVPPPDYVPLDLAEKGQPPALDFLGKLQKRAVNALKPWKKPQVKVLVVPVEFPDQSGTIKKTTFEDYFFADGLSSLTGFFSHHSGEKLDISGEVLPWTKVRIPRRFMTRIPGSLVKMAYYPRLLAKVEKSLKVKAKAFDVVVFVVAGKRVPKWGSLFWPHAGALITDGKRLRKIVLAEFSGKKNTFQRRTLRHEFGHSLGILDKYCYLKAMGWSHTCTINKIRTECLMGSGTAPCAWCRIRLGWSEAKTLRWGVEQRIRLKPLEQGGHVAQVFLDGGNRFLLIAYNNGKLRVWRLGQFLQRFSNHLFWENMDCVVAQEISPGIDKAFFSLPQGVRLSDVHLGSDGELRLKIRYRDMKGNRKPEPVRPVKPAPSKLGKRGARF